MIANVHKLLTQVHDNQRFQEHEWNEDVQPYQELDLINQSLQSLQHHHQRLVHCWT